MKTLLSKKSLIALVVLLIALALAHTANAQSTDIDFTSIGQLNADANIDDVGANVFAYDANLLSTTVNGINFSGSTTQNGISITTNFAIDANGNTYGTKSAAIDGLSQALFNTVAGGLYSSGGHNSGASQTVELSGLTSGDVYQVELVVFDDRDFDGSSAYSETVEGQSDATISSPLYFGGPNSGPTTADGSYVIATFTASGTTETFDLTGSPQLNALVLNDETAASPSVPEPATYLMIGLGLVGLVVLRRARGSNVA